MKTSVNIKMEETLRNEAKRLFESMGLDMTTAVNIFIRTAVRENGIPFPLSGDTSEVLKANFEHDLALSIKQSEEEFSEGKALSFKSEMSKIRGEYGF